MVNGDLTPFLHFFPATPNAATGQQAQTVVPGARPVQVKVTLTVTDNQGDVGSPAVSTFMLQP